jgi:hypothetical protein
MDALTLSRFPKEVWEKCEAAIIEVWAHEEISESEVARLLSMFQNFEQMGWKPIFGDTPEVQLSEISEFWLSKSGAQRNLFLSQNT